MSLSQALNTSTAGLRTTQAGLSLIAANVANAETPGYVRKTLVQTTASAGGSGPASASRPSTANSTSICSGSCATKRPAAAMPDLRADFYSRLQSVYGEPGADATLEVAFNDFAVRAADARHLAGIACGALGRDQRRSGAGAAAQRHDATIFRPCAATPNSGSATRSRAPTTRWSGSQPSIGSSRST